MNSNVRRTSLLFFVFALLLAAALVVWPFISSTGPSHAQELPEPLGYTSVQQILSPDADGALRPQMVIVRYQSGKGDYRTEEMDFKNGRLVARQNGIIISSRGRNAVLRVGTGAFLGSPLQSIAVDEHKLRSSPSFIGEGEILGYKALLLKNPEQGVISWTVPRFGKVPLRLESEFMTIDTVHLTPGEPPAELFSTEAEVPEVDTEGFEILLKTLPHRIRDHYNDQLGRFHETEESRRDRQPPNQ